MMDLVLNGEATHASEGATVADLLASLGVPEKGVAVERNLEIVPKSAFSKTHLQSGDRLEIIQFVGGG
ncbi:MAG: sulfur carrier protein ThiS [Pseudomonadota bacterium]